MVTSDGHVFEKRLVLKHLEVCSPPTSSLPYHLNTVRSNKTHGNQMREDISISDARKVIINQMQGCLLPNLV